MVVQSIGLVTDLRNQNKNIGVLYIATGLVTEGDNNGGVFWWNPSSTAADDGVDVIQVTGTATGRWVRITDNNNSVPSSRTLTINGVTYDLSADRTWSVGTITGSGTANYISKFTSSSALGNSLVYDNGTSVMVGTTTPNVSFTGKLIVASGTNTDLEIRSTGNQSALHLSLGTTDTDIKPRVELFNSGNFGIVMYKPGVVNSNYLMYYDAESVSNRSLSFQTEGQNRLILNQTGSIRAPRYGGGLVTGTPTYRIATDASGNFIEVTDAGGSVTSVDMTVPTGLTISGNPIVTSGTLALGLAAGYFIPTTSSQANWDAAYNDKINSANVTGTTTKTLTLTQQDGGTITASWSDYDTAPVTSVFGRTGAVVAAEGDYNLNQLGDVIISSPTNGQVLKYNGAEWVNNTDTDTGLTSVGLTMPSAFAVSNSPLTSNGTIAVTGAGTSAQYVRGDGQLATLPSFAGGGSSVNYYLNGSINASVAGYKQLSMNAIIGVGTNFTLTGNGLIAQFLTDAGDPNRIQIPGGAWNFETYFSSSSNGGSEGFYIELLKYDGSTFTLIASSVSAPESITGGTSNDLYVSSVAVPTTTLATTDRLAIRVYIINNSGARTITLHTEDNNLCQVITTFAGGVASLNGLTANTQYFATGTTGMDFNISSVSDTHTFNIPDASATARGLITTGTQTIAGAKTFSSSPIVPSLYLTNMTAGSGALYYGLAANRLTLANYNVGGSIVFEVNGGQYAMEIKSDLGIRFDGYTTNGFLKTSGSNGTLIVDTTSYVPTTRQLTINGTAYDLSADRSWSVGTVTSVAALTLGTTGTDLSSTVATGTTTPVITLNVPTASATNRGVLSSADWTTFNNKQNALTNPVTGTGTAGQVAFFSGTSAITGENNLFWNALYNRLGVNTNNPYLPVDIVADELGYNLSLRGEPSNAVAHIRFYSNDGITPYSHIKSTDTEFLLGSIATNDVIFVSSGVEGIRITNTQQVKLSNIPQAVTDTNRFLVSDLGYIKYRTGAEILSDIGAQGLLTLTTTGSSGASTLISNTLNIPTYTLSGLGGVPTTRTLTINGTAYDLSADRSWSVGTVTTAAATTGGQVMFSNGATVITSVSGLYFDGINRLGIGTMSPLYNLDVTGTARMTGNLTAASIIKSGGTSSQYLMADGSTSTLTNPVTGTGTTNYLPKWTSGSALGNSLVYDSGTAIGIGTTNPGGFSGVLAIRKDSGTIASFNSIGTNGAKIEFLNIGVDTFGVGMPISSGDLAFYSSATTERLRITSTGNLLLNSTTDNGNRLQVTGNGYFSGLLGVGTTNPQLILDVVGQNQQFGSTTAYRTARFFSTSAVNADRPGIILGYDTNGGGVIAGATEANGQPINFWTYNGSSWGERMRLDPSGNLGVGTSSPAGKLTVADSVNNGTANVLYLSNTSQTGVTSAAINFINIDGAIKSSIIGAVYGNDYMTFNVGSNTERMRISASGNLGLSVVPSAWTDYKAFQVNTGASLAANPNQLVLGSNWYYGSGDKYIISDYATIYVQNSGQHKWFTAPSGTAGNAITFTQAMTLTASGRLLLGTTTDAGYLLDVNGTGRFNGLVRIDGQYVQIANATNPSLYLSNTVVQWQLKNNSSNNLVFNDGAADRITFAYGGAATFSSSVAAGGKGIFETNTTVGYDGTYPGYASIGLGGTTNGFNRVFGGVGTADGLFLASATGRGIYFRAGGGITDQVTVTSGGNLLVGTTTDSGYRLDVNGYIQAANRLYVTNIGNNVQLQALSGGSGNMGIQVRNASGGSNGSFSINSDGGNVLIGTTTDSGERLVVSGSAKVTSTLTAQSNIDLSGDIRYQSNVGYGIKSANGSRLVEIYNGLFAVTGVGTFSSSDLNNIFVSNPDTTGATTGSGIGFKAYNGTSVSQSAGIILTSNTWSFGTYSANQLSVGSDGTGGAAIRTANSAPITFFTGGSTAGLSTERMRITSAGNVGIGTTSPSAKLQVYGSGLISTNVTSTDNQAQFYLQGTFGQIENGVGEFYLTNSASSSPMIFRTATTERMRITSGGNLLVGTSTDSGERLFVSGNIKNTYSILRGDALEQWQGASDTAEIGINYLGYNSGTSYFRNFSVYNGKSSKVFGIVGSTGAATFSSTIQTAAPTGGTARPWKLGQFNSSVDLPATGYVEVEINGVFYKLLATT